MNDLGYFPSQKNQTQKNQTKPNTPTHTHKKKTTNKKNQTQPEKQEASVLKSSQIHFSSQFKSYSIMDVRRENALTCLLYGKLKMPSIKDDPFLEKQGCAEGNMLC